MKGFSRKLIAALAAFCVALSACALFRSGNDEPAEVAVVLQGPDGKPLPGTENGEPIPPFEEREIEIVRHEWLVPFLLPLKLTVLDNPETEGKFDVDLGIPPPVTVEWSRDGDVITLRFVIRGQPFVARVRTHPDGPCTIDELEGETATAQFFGVAALYFARNEACGDLVWVQYVQRNTEFLDAAGNEVATHQLGPEIDRGVPYLIQSQLAAGDGAVMEDGPGVSAPLGQAPAQVASTSLDRFKNEAGQQANDTIASADVAWKFWTYLICLTPEYRVIGRLEWGFRLVVDPTATPPITKPAADVQAPVWTAGP